MKRCASCGREISETATVCDLCERWAADQIQLTAAHSTPHARPAATTEPLSASPSTPQTFTAAPQPLASAPQAKSTQPQAAPAAAALRAVSRLSRRELMIIAAGILVLGSVITFALGGSRDGEPATATATAPARTPSKATAAAAPRPVFTQTWSAARRPYWTANQRHAAAFELPAENTVAIWMNYVRPILVVRCMNKRIETFVYTGSALKIEPNTEDHTVNFRFDDEANHAEHWPDSAEHDALFSPDGAAFAQRVLSSKSFRFGYTPHNAEPAEAQFHVDGLASLIDPAAAKDCGWQK